MARILFGVCGDGLGHGTRSKATIDHLLQRGHEVRIVSSRKGYEYLSQYFDVLKIPGLRVVHRGYEIRRWETVREFLLHMVKHGAPVLKRLSSEIGKFKPDVIISDFEPSITAISRIKRIPLLSIDNQHAITLCKLEYPRAWRTEYLLAHAWCMGYIADYYFITTFFAPAVRKRAQGKVTQVGPILRSELFEQVPYVGDYILVYMRSSERVNEISPLLEQLEDRFIVYGSNEVTTVNNITFKTTSADEFPKDLVGCKAVITNGGHSLLSEALYLGKPVYSLPTRRDFEQMINAYYLGKLGYGLYDLEPSLERLQTFMRELPRFNDSILRDRDNFNGNESFFQVLDSKVEEMVLRRGLSGISARFKPIRRNIQNLRIRI